MLEFLRDIFQQSVEKSFPHLEGIRVEVTESTQAKFGHYQCNSAMKLSKALKKNPQEIARIIVDNTKIDDLMEPLEIAGPGFINIRLTQTFLEKKLASLSCDPLLGVITPKKEKVVIDFSSPNVAKEMHVGHLRSTILGDCLANIFEFCGHEVVRLNHIGDWGTQFGMLIGYLKEKNLSLENASLSDLMTWYKSSKKEFDTNETFKKRATEEVVRLQSGDEENLQLWETICAISREGYQEIYDLLQVSILERGESFYNPMLPQVVADLQDRGLIKVSNGAKCVFVEGEKVPLMVQKSDGGYNYDTTDMAALKHRIVEEKADRIYYLTDLGQALHFKLVFKVAEMAKYLDPKKTDVHHIPFGLVLGPDGKKFRTRSGETEKLIDLIQEAVVRAKKVVLEKQGERPDVDAIAKTIGLAAIKYADLATHRQSDYQFSYDKMLQLDGNTAPYLLYAFVRTKGIERQASQPKGAIVLKEPQEIFLALKLVQFADVLEKVMEEMTPNRLTDYLYTLSNVFSAFFRDCRVVGSPFEASRLSLVALVSQTLQTGLQLLGIQTLDRM